jgi:hypothetical protein
MKLIKFVSTFIFLIILGCENKKKIELIERLKTIEQYTSMPVGYRSLNDLSLFIGEEIYVQGYIKEISILERGYTRLYKEESGGFDTYILYERTKKDIVNKIQTECNAGCFIRIKTKVFQHRDGIYLTPTEIVETYSMILKKETEKELSTFK